MTFHSYTEPHLCPDNEMVRGILLAVLATMAKQEAYLGPSDRKAAPGALGLSLAHAGDDALGQPRVYIRENPFNVRSHNHARDH